MNDLDERMLKAELEIDRLIEGMKEMYASMKDMKAELHAIQRHLNQIKYFAMGAVALYAGNSTGILKFIVGL